MNQDPTSHHWSPMLANPDNEFADFLDFGDLTFSAFNDATLNNHGENTTLARGGAGGIDAQTEDPATAISMGQRGMRQKMEIPRNQISIPPDFYDVGTLNPDLFHQQHDNQSGTHQHGYHPTNMVPPTPTSIEIQAGQPHYYPIIDQQQRQFYDHYRLQQRHQMNFTPLISPAVTPLDTQLCYPDYAASSEHFSPLTSPTLHTQNHAATASLYGAARGSDTSDTTSPIDPTLEYVGPTSVPATPASLRKSRRRVSTSSSKPPARTVKQSPAMKPQSKKKAASSTVIPPKEVAGILEEARQNKKGTGRAKSGTEAKRPTPYQQDSSGPDSVSPEPLSEILMPPPATPRSSSSGKSPYMSAKKPSKAGLEHDQNGEAVTPASLMHIHKRVGSSDVNRSKPADLKEQASLAEADMEQIMEDITLPEPATSFDQAPSLKPLDTAHANTHQSTPVVSAQKKSDKATKSAPVTAIGSTFPSPSIKAVASPTGPEARKRRDSKSKSKEILKRTNANIEKPSPAIKPRISPSIKPLLPEGSNVSADTTALLLASKSNYQNILEGTHFPGVSYPENLSTNLSSKRTSHKIAEQGRRNRINLALQEISALLPASANVNGGGSGTDGEASKAKEAMNHGTAAQQSNNSKASTVEAAIEYIRALQGELRSCREKIAGYEREMGGHGLKENAAERGKGIGTSNEKEGASAA